MVGKILLPYLGGTPAVWNTCMVFFQVALLAGYFYSDFVIRKLTPRRQAIVHTALLLTSLLRSYATGGRLPAPADLAFHIGFIAGALPAVFVTKSTPGPSCIPGDAK